MGKTNPELRSKFRKIKNPNNNNTVEAVENVEQQEPPIQNFAAELLQVTRHTNQLLTHICTQLDVIVGELLKDKMERIYTAPVVVVPT
ncbi:hypothetical protein TSUD_206670 [Trifolium subterraneum]|uniref:Uncharacterized protein n=1 Tax=Trifolium subterraneum TaxID=3900 RepID=A0A2Z6N111_TRISU|nr:hypothetical protein TSUD_206670 [Trifolium subterraneum]